MGFKFTPMTKEQQDERGKFYKEGFVDFVVLSLEEKISQAGNNMLVINLQLWDETGKNGTIKDHITENATWKLHDFLESIGYKEDADTGDIDLYKYRGCEGRGRVKYKKDEDGKWKLQFNYVMPEMKSQLTPEPNDSLDDIKF